jgi:hypothetical protein
MRRIVCLLMGVVAATSLRAETELLPMSPPARESKYQIGVETWLTRGENNWQVSFVEFEPGLGAIPGRSRLDWEKLDAIVYRLRGEYTLQPSLRVGASLGLGSLREGENSDRDWFTIGGEEFLFFQSEADTRGDIRALDVNLYARLNELMPRRKWIGEWDLVFGFLYHEEDLNDRNGYDVFLFGETIREPLEGLDTTFNFEWRALRVGLRGDVPVRDRVWVRGSAVALLGVDYSGEGYWNLREDFRDASPNFVQEADAGYGADIQLSMKVQCTERVFVEVGYSLLTLRVDDGVDTIYFADGAEVDTKLDWARTTRHGLTLAVHGAF